MSNSFAAPWTVAHQAPLPMELKEVKLRQAVQGPVRRRWTLSVHAFLEPCATMYLTQELAFLSVQFSRSVVSDSLWPHESHAARQASLSNTNSWSLLKLMSYESVMPSSHLILCHPLLLLSPIPPSIRVFSNESTLHMRWPAETGVSTSASVLPVSTQDWSPLGWTGWTSLQPKGLSRVFSNTTVQKHQFFGVQLSLQSNSHIHTWLLEKP